MQFLKIFILQRLESISMFFEVPMGAPHFVHIEPFIFLRTKYMQAAENSTERRDQRTSLSVPCSAAFSPVDVPLSSLCLLVSVVLDFWTPESIVASQLR